MTDALLAWRAIGTVESLLVLAVPVALLVGVLLGRWPRLDTAWSWLTATVVAALGGFAAHQRLAALPWALTQEPERLLMTRVARSEAHSFSVLGGALLLAALVAAGWAWRRSSHQDGPVILAPTATLAMALPTALLGARVTGPLPSPGDGFPLLVAGTLALVLGSALRPGPAWQGPALSWLTGTALVAHASVAKALALDPDVTAALPRLLWTRDLGMALAAAGILVALPSLRHRLAWPLMGVPAVALPWALQLPSLWAHHPDPAPWPATLQHPGPAPSRLAGGCLVGPDGIPRPHGLRSEPHRLLGCDEGSLLTVNAPSDTPLGELSLLATGHDDLGFLTHLHEVPSRVEPWFQTRWAVPVWRMEGDQPSPRPVRGSLVVTSIAPLEVVGPGGATDLESALATPGRREVLVVAGAGDLQGFRDLCVRAMELRPESTRCGLALGDVDAWQRWATRPLPTW